VFCAGLAGEQLRDDRRDLGDLIEANEGIDLGIAPGNSLAKRWAMQPATINFLLAAAFCASHVLVYPEDLADRLLLRGNR